MKVKTAFIVDDYVPLQTAITDYIKEIFGASTVVYTATTLKSAEIIFDTHGGEFDLILMDTSLGGGEFTFELTKKIAQTYKGPLVAISTDEKKRKHMVRHGCTSTCDKKDLPKYLEFLRDSR